MLLNYHIGRFVLVSLCVGDLVRLGLSSIRVAGWSLQPAKRTPPKASRIKSSNTQRTENKTTDVVIQQHSRKLLMMVILMSETFWAHKKWNKIASDIKLVFHSSTITKMHGPINIRDGGCLLRGAKWDFKWDKLCFVLKGLITLTICSWRIQHMKFFRTFILYSSVANSAKRHAISICISETKVT
jgi:hypothetical protein